MTLRDFLKVVPLNEVVVIEFDNDSAEAVADVLGKILSEKVLDMSVACVYITDGKMCVELGD